MKKWLERLEAMAMAVAFAEAGEWAYAEKIMDRKTRQPVKLVRSNRTPDRRPRMRV